MMQKTMTTLALMMLMTVNVWAQFQSIQITKTGTGEPVLLLPGFTSTGEVWRETVTDISQHKTCHVVNYAGFGNVPAIDTLWLQTIQQELKQYIRQSDFGSITIVGHSMGGTLALWLATDSTLPIKQLFVVDALPCMGAITIPNYNPEKISYDTPYSNNLLNMSEEEFKAMADNYARFMSLTESGQNQIAKWIVESDRKTYVHGYVDLLKVDLREDLAKIEARVKILAAAFPNKEMIAKNYERQYKKLEAKEITYVENSAHFIMYDKYNAYIQQLKQFLNLSANEAH